MARLAVTFTVIFCLFAISSARNTLDLPEADVYPDLSGSRAETDNKPTILLPSENPDVESDQNSVTEAISEAVDPIQHESTTESIKSAAEDLPEYNTITVDVAHLARPSTFVSFRPVNRHFGVKRHFPFSMGRMPHRGLRRPCHHHRMRPEVIPYGNDMILSGESSDFDPMMFRGGVRQIPARWVRFHHHHDDGMPRFPYRHHHMFKRPFRHEEEEEKEEREMGNEGEQHREDDGGFMMRFRNFLNHF